MNLKKALDTIGYVLGTDIEDALKKEGSDFDEQLALEIGIACKKWEDRQDDLEQPWAVAFFDGKSWSYLEIGLRQTDAYRLWWQSTDGGSKNNDPREETYYFMCPEGIELSGRHEHEDDEDGFSYRYLLDKSFGE
jgi:hypothetical protein